MESVGRILLTVYFVIVLGAEAIGCAYFASVVNWELRPYFDSHGMKQESSDASQAFGYLVASAVISGLSVILTLWKLCLGERSEDDEDDDNKGDLLSSLLSVAAAITMVVFACLTIQHSWGWWRHFASDGNGHLASASHGLAALLITIMVLSTAGSIVKIMCWFGSCTSTSKDRGGDRF
ncbi:hypothetical protein GGR53DRAFT_532021 [Hypoxylon sp. FL1150]|nr:hypothetical protein GGR53DRAFT_532021 [Hypoxylon sp. FL1150]